MDGKYLLFWLFGLGAALSPVAFFWNGKKSSEGKRPVVLPGLLTLLPLLLNIPLAYGCYQMYFMGFRPNWFFFVVSWGAAYLLGSVGIVLLSRKAPFVSRRMCVLGTGLSFLLLVGSYLWIDAGRCRELRAIRSRSEETLRKLTPQPPPEAEDGTPLYEKALELLGDSDDLPMWTREFPLRARLAAEPGEILEFLKENGEVLDLLRKAARCPAISVDEDSSLLGALWRGNERSFLYDLPGLARLLAQEAIELAKAGDSDAAFRSLDSIRGIARHLLQIPHEINVILGMGLIRMEAKTAEYILSRSGEISVPDIYLQRLDIPLRDRLPGQLEFQKADFLKFLTTMVLAEEARKDLEGLLDARQSRNLEEIGFLGEGYFGLYRLTLQFYRVFLIPSDLHAVENILSELLAQAEKPHREGPFRISLERHIELGFSLLAAPYLSSIEGIVNHAADLDAAQGLLRLTLAVHAYRAAHDAYPEDLKQLVPQYLKALPLDPYGGKPFQSSPLDGGLVLYSAGIAEELEDHSEGDEPDWEAIATRSGSLVFALGSAPERVYRRLYETREEGVEEEGGE